MIRARILHTVGIIGVFLLLSDCQDMGINPEGPGRLLLGVGAEGVRLGDSPETVRAALGAPYSVGDIFGVYRGWSHYTYADSGKVKLTLAFIDNGSGLGPLDAITCGPAYRGKTSEGIGIGSSIHAVHQAYGLPDTTLKQSFWTENFFRECYCMHGHKLVIDYQDNLVLSFWMGYFVPCPEDPLDPCRGHSPEPAGNGS